MSVDDRVQQMLTDLSALRKAQREEDRQSPGKDGGGTSGGMGDDWKQNVDRQLGQLHDDVRSMLRWGTGATVAIAGVIGGLYLHVDGKVDAINNRLDGIAQSQARIEAKLDQTTGREQRNEPAAQPKKAQ